MATSTSSAREEARRKLPSSPDHRLLLRRLQRDGDHLDTSAISPAPCPRCSLLLGFRGVGAIRGDRDAPRRRRQHKDAIFLSPHKLIGGPGTPGVLVVRRDLLHNEVPVVPGGGTVQFGARPPQLPERPRAPQEAGTPAIIESIRAGLVFRLKESVGVDTIRGLEHEFIRRAIESWSPTRTSRSSATQMPNVSR